MSTFRMGKLGDIHFPIIQCKACGFRWLAKILDNGNKAPGTWQCPQGCKREDIPLTDDEKLKIHSIISSLKSVNEDLMGWREYRPWDLPLKPKATATLKQALAELEQIVKNRS